MGNRVLVNEGVGPFYLLQGFKPLILVYIYPILHDRIMEGRMANGADIGKRLFILCRSVAPYSRAGTWFLSKSPPTTPGG